MNVLVLIQTIKLPFKPVERYGKEFKGDYFTMTLNSRGLFSVSTKNKI